jgi:acid phosphatase family membrane protein YuiD
MKDQFWLSGTATRQDLLDAIEVLADALNIRREAGHDAKWELLKRFLARKPE